MRQTLSGRVFACLPETGSITAPEVCARLKKLGIRRDVRSITGILWHLRCQGCARKVKRKADDDEKIVNRWAKGRKVYVNKTRIKGKVPPSFDSLLNFSPITETLHWTAIGRVFVYGDAARSIQQRPESRVRDELQEGAL